MTQDEIYMHRCIQLAKNGRMNARPNPMVGAVIVCDGQIIGEGYHIRCGEGHAEVNAFASVKPQDEPLLREASIYVSLEPCSHYGKTPPCADLIIDKGVRRVVVGCPDPFAQVHGRGIQKLRDAGIRVEVGVCEKECKELNKVFFTFHQLKRPFITLKWAQSADEFIGKTDENGNPKTAIISNEFTQMHCHKLRTEHQAVLVGKTTLDCDDPSLTSRYWPGPNPLRIILTHNEDIDRTLKICQGDAEIIIVGGELNNIMVELHEKGIQSLLVEGGRDVLQQFIDADLWDEAYVEFGEKLLVKGVKAPIITLFPTVTKDIKHFFGKTIMHYRNHKNDFFNAFKA